MKKRIVSIICVLTLVFLLIPMEVHGSDIDTYGDGLLKFESNKKYGYTDIFGNTVIKATFMSADPFHNGMAHVQVGGGGYAKDEFINRSGKVVFSAPKKTKTTYYGLCDTWEGDYATAEIWSIGKKGDITSTGYNYVDEKGKLFNDDVYQYAGSFEEGYALVGKGYSIKKPSRCSMESKNEHWLAVFNGNSSSRVATEYYYIDKQGKQLGSMTWSIGRDFNNGMAAVAIQAGDSLHWGFIDSTGTLQVSPEYIEVGDFENGMAWVCDGDHYGYINEKGDVVIPLTWKSAKSFGENGYAIVKDDYHAKLIDKQGNIVLDTEYSEMYPVGNTKRYIVDDGFAKGMIDSTGKILVSPAFQYAYTNGHVFCGTRYDNILVICNEFGDIVTPVIVNGSVVAADDENAYPEGTPCKKIPFTASDGSALNACTFVDEQMKTLTINLVDDMRGDSFTISHSNGKTVFFDLDGKQLGSNEWDGFHSAASNEYVTCVYKGDFMGFIDTHTGETIITPQYTGVRLFDDGVFCAMLGNNSAFLDRHARTILPEITKKTGKEDIKAFQQLLADLGYYTGKINGSFSAQLTEAITAAQEALGLDPTGIADSDLQYALQESKK